MKKRTVRRTPQAKILGSHPTASHALGQFLEASDGKTNSGVPHRALSEANDGRKAAIEYLREVLVDHHASPQALRRTEQHREAMKRIGFGAAQKQLRRFPSNLTTQKGNLAEIVLAEYVVAANGLSLPVYRLRYNPNVEQSMKGDDVLAFDLDSNPVRIVVGEAKFRGTPSKAAVTDIVKGLLRSYKGGVARFSPVCGGPAFRGGPSGVWRACSRVRSAVCEWATSAGLCRPPHEQHELGGANRQINSWHEDTTRNAFSGRG